MTLVDTNILSARTVTIGMGIHCPHVDCDAGPYDSGHALSVHWGMNHEGSVPDEIDASRSESVKEAISEANEGVSRPDLRGEKNPNSGGLDEEHRQNLSEALTGRTLSDEHKQAVSEGLKGRTHSAETRRKISEALSGRTRSEEEREAMRGPRPNQQGENNPLWKPGEYEPGPLSQEEKDDIREAFNRVCQECGKHTDEQPRRMSVHHIDGDTSNNDPENLTVLCNSCHMAIHREESA